MLYSIFDQSIIDFTGTGSSHDSEDSALRAVMAYATDDTTVELLPRMKQGNAGLARSAKASLKELEEVCQLPKAKELWTKQDGWIHVAVTEILEPIDMSKIMSTTTKLKIALSEMSTRNAQLVMRNDELRLQLSFMPPQMWDVICDARDNKALVYSDQRENPKYLLPVRETEFYYDSADPNDQRI